MSDPTRTPDVVAAEKAVLGSALMQRWIAEQVVAVLPDSDAFGESVHQAVHAAVRYVVETGTFHGPPSVLGRLVAVERGVWRTGQAGVIVATLMEHSTPDFLVHAVRVRKAATRRKGLLALGRAQQVLEDPAADPDEAVDQARVLLDEAVVPVVDDGQAVTAEEAFREAVDRIETGRPRGKVRFPFLDLQHLMPFMLPGQLVSIGARPSVGKSVFAQCCARYTGLTQQLPVALFTLEMDRAEVTDRLIAAEAGVPLQCVIDGTLSPRDWDRVTNVYDRFAEGRLVIDHTPRITVPGVRARLRQMRRDGGVELAIVDYLQLMDGGGGENRQREVSGLVAGLKAVAREFAIPVMMLFQLNRGPESRSDKRPYMSDARESGAIENDSDVVILIHREDQYDRESARVGEADLIVDKNRAGPKANIVVAFQGEYARFVDMAPILREPDARYAEDAPRWAS